MLKNIDNYTKTIIYVGIGNFVAFLLFLVAYFITKELWYLIAAVINLMTIFVVFFLIKTMQNKIK
jgi:VIT1/CCC1 family predicted Fe2+/Mn2+ transporter